MPDYQKMYHSLFNDVTEVITKLQQAQQKTEELYINSKETVLTPLHGGASEKEPKEETNRNSALKKKKPPSHDER